MTNRAYAKSNGDGFLCSILCYERIVKEANNLVPRAFARFPGYKVARRSLVDYSFRDNEAELSNCFSNYLIPSVLAAFLLATRRCVQSRTHLLT
jgi:hypothetical protein